MRTLTAVALLLLGACSQSYDSLGEPVVLTGSGVVYQRLWHHTRPALALECGNAEMLGLIRVDLATGAFSLVPGGDVDLPCRYDARGRRFRFRVDRILVDGPGGPPRVLRTGSFFQNLCLAVDDGATFVLFVARPGLDEDPCLLIRVNAETGESVTLPMPADLTVDPAIGDGQLSAQSRDVVFLTAGNRTWRGDFAGRTWGAPIDGSFEVIDSRGTLFERREESWLAGTRNSSDPRVTVIRNGAREEIDLGHGGWAHPVFGTGYVRVQDMSNDRYLFRSLEGKPDIVVPWRPEEHEGEPEIR